MFSATVVEKRTVSWWTTAYWFRRSASLYSFRSTSSSVIMPSLGSKRRVRRVERVVLPEPVGPTTPRQLPGGSSNDTLWSTSWSFLYLNETSRNSILPLALSRGSGFGDSGTSG